MMLHGVVREFCEYIGMWIFLMLGGASEYLHVEGAYHIESIFAGRGEEAS